MNRFRHNGFSLTELVVVMAIIGALLGIAVPMYSNYATAGYGAEAVNNIYNLEIMLSDYYADNGTYLTGEYDATGTKTLQTGALKWKPGEDDANQQYKYAVKTSASCGNNIGICYEITATGLGRKVKTNERVRKPSDGKIIFEQIP